MPLHVTIVSPEATASRVPDPLVRTELAYLAVRHANRRSANHLRHGDIPAALADIRDAQATAAAALVDAPDHLRSQLIEAIESLRYLAEKTEHRTITRAADSSSAHACSESPHRGHYRPGPGPLPPP